jgi:hypothetical protein
LLIPELVLFLPIVALSPEVKWVLICFFSYLYLVNCKYSFWLLGKFPANLHLFIIILNHFFVTLSGQPDLSSKIGKSRSDITRTTVTKDIRGLVGATLAAALLSLSVLYTGNRCGGPFGD